MTNKNINNNWRYSGYRALVGSRLYNLNTEASDEDWRGWFSPPIRHVLSFNSVHSTPETISMPDSDEQSWEIKKFLSLLLSSNPNALETLWSDRYEYPNGILKEFAQELRENRKKFLSKQIVKSFGGYARGQIERGKKELSKDPTRGRKAFMHTFRLLISAECALLHGDLLVDMTSHRDFLLDVRNSEKPIDEIERLYSFWDDGFRRAFEQTSLPDSPDAAYANDFLLRVRLSGVN